MTDTTTIRPECFRPAETWVRPTTDEIREILRLAGFSGGEAARRIGVRGKDGKSGGRTVRKWISGEADIPYAAWALLCHYAGFGIIWENIDCHLDH